MSLLDRFEESIVKGICRTQLYDVCDDRERFNQLATGLGLEPKGVVERVGYAIGWYIERTEQ